MSTKIAISDRMAALKMFNAGLSEGDVKNGLDTIKKPTAGYYYPGDVDQYINKTRIANWSA